MKLETNHTNLKGKAEETFIELLKVNEQAEQMAKLKEIQDLQIQSLNAAIPLKKI